MEKIALASDVEAMFHQVKERPEDCGALRFLWWPNGDLSQEPTDHQMLVHVFGATSSPSCCSFSLRKTADDNRHTYDEKVVRTVKNNFYVDDCLVSVETEQEAINLAHDVTKLLSDGGFRLTKWMSNSKAVIASIPEDERAVTVKSMDLDNLPVERTLGVQWNVETDQFEIRTVQGCKPTTRRGILSVVSSLYDPLGFVAPVTLIPKILLQNLSRSLLGWDDPVDDRTRQEWEKWKQNLDKLDNVKIPRCFKSSVLGNITNVQLHIFADASETGYGAAAYFRYVDTDGTVTCSFIMGKSRVAPVKVVSIPRLALSAAVVAVRVYNLIREELPHIDCDDVILWTDSTTVLQYINNESRRFKTFVANRLTTIHEATTPAQWRHVGTDDNPADHASRGISPYDTDKLTKWLNGPDFLTKDESCWPIQTINQSDISDELLEVKRVVDVNVNVNLVTEDTSLDTLFARYSNWEKLKRSVAWLLRYKKYCCNRYLHNPVSETHRAKYITVKDMNGAEDAIVKYVQTKYLSDDYTKLHSDEKVSSGSALRKLNPVLVEGVMRVGGRIDRSPMTFDSKHPAILPNNNHVTTLLIRHYHITEGHSGRNHVLSVLQRKYWVVSGMSAVKRVLNSCIDCKRRHGPRMEQLMSSLPKEHVTPDCPPFTYVGVDCFGPLNVKVGRSVCKRYGCIFTCLNSRAVHIEILYSLETDSFISGLLRFISRRGKPEKMISDNGTNFKGADSELKEALRQLNQQRINDSLSQREIEWSFNPPTASHMGGVWERLIRSVRNILKALVKEQLLNDESLLTFMTEVERILNDRPLTSPSPDHSDLPPLTPNDLLRLKPTSSLPISVVTESDRYSRRWWRQAQYLTRVFWRRWLHEYLPTLQQRQKWTEKRRNLQVDNLVLVSDSNAPRGQWPLGRVVETYPDNHGLVRSAKIRCGATYKVRPIAKLCLLECDN